MERYKRPFAYCGITVIQDRLSDKVANSEFSQRDGAFLIIPYRPRKDTDQDEDTERGRLTLMHYGLRRLRRYRDLRG